MAALDLSVLAAAVKRGEERCASFAEIDGGERSAARLSALRLSDGHETSSSFTFHWPPQRLIHDLMLHQLVTRTILIIHNLYDHLSP